MMGFEPTTTGITIRDSNQLSYTHHIFFQQMIEQQSVVPVTNCTAVLS